MHSKRIGRTFPQNIQKLSYITAGRSCCSKHSNSPSFIRLICSFRCIVWEYANHTHTHTRIGLTRASRNLKVYMFAVFRTWWTKTSTGSSRGTPSRLVMDRKPKPMRTLNHLHTPSPEKDCDSSSVLGLSSSSVLHIPALKSKLHLHVQTYMCLCGCTCACVCV